MMLLFWAKLKLNNNKIIVGFMNFDFMGGSMGRAVGGGIVKGAFEATSEKCPYILFTCSGGAQNARRNSQFDANAKNRSCYRIAK